MDYDFDDGDILDENDDFDMNHHRVASQRNNQSKQPAAVAKKNNSSATNAAAIVKANQKSSMNYGDDLGFSDEDDDGFSNIKSNGVNDKSKNPTNGVGVERTRGGIGASHKRSASPSPVAQKRVDNQKQHQHSSALPPIQSVLRASQFNDSDDDEFNNDKKPSTKGVSAAADKNKSKAQSNKHVVDVDLDDDLDDLDNILVAAAATPASPKNPKQQISQKPLSQQQQQGNKRKDELDDDYNGEEEEVENSYDGGDYSFEPTTEQKNKQVEKHNDSGSELSDLPELEYDDPQPQEESHKKKAAHVASSESFLVNPISKENRSTRQGEQQKDSMNEVGASAGSRNNERRRTVDSVSSKAATAATGVGIGSRAGANSRDSRMKPPVPFPAGNKKYMVKKIGGGTSVIGGEGLKELLRDRDYEQMNFKEIKGENDALREKLRSFNAQLTEKVEQSQAIMTKQAAEKSVAASSKPRTRSNQMRTADAETDNNQKIMKRLEDELTKLTNRQSTLENPSYASNLKVQVETSANLINKFKLQAKQIQLKNDQQAKELNKLSKVEGANDGMKEGHGIQSELQLMHDKIKELEKKRADFEDLFARKGEAIEVKEADLAKKIKEAKAMGVSVNFTVGDSQSKRIAKHRDLQKALEQMEKKNATLMKMHKTKEVLFYREIDEIAKDVLEKDNEIKALEANLIQVKTHVSDTIENEKIYMNHNSKNLREFLERDTAISMTEPSETIADSARKHNPLKNNNLFENEKPLPQSSKPNMKFKKVSEDRTHDSEAKEGEEENNTSTVSEAKQQGGAGTNESGINFHQKKLHSRTNLNDISNNQEDNQPVSTKPFSLKKSSAGVASEPRIWKPDMDSQSQTESNSGPYPAPTRTNNDPSAANPNSFNFKQKLTAQSQADLPKASALSQENVKPASPVVKPAVDSSNSTSGDNIFEKPQRMFRFKRGENNNSSNDAQPDNQDAKPSADQSLTNPTQVNAAAVAQSIPAKEEGYSFSTNSRVSRIRGNPQQSDNSNVSATSYQPSAAESKQLDNLANLPKPPAAVNAKETTTPSSGYQFSGMGGGQQAEAAPRRRVGGNPSGSAFDSDLNSDSLVPAQQQQQQQKPSSSLGNHEDAFEFNGPSRRNRGQSKNNEPTGGMTSIAEQQKVEAPEKKNDDSKWSWNSNSNTESNNNAGQAKGLTSALDTPFTMDPAPKSFNFKRNSNAAVAQTTTITEQQSASTAIPTTIIQQQQQQPLVQQKPIEQSQPQQPQQVGQQPKKDEFMFKGPNDRRINVNRTTANDTKKVIKRDIFADEPAEITLPDAGFMQPKEIGSTHQSSQPQASTKPLQAHQQQKKSALDDDDEDAAGGLDFLKQDKPKVNYNDDDDMFAAKRPSNPPQGVASLGGPSKLNVKKAQQDTINASKQEREKNLASKAKNDDFFDDLF